MALVEKSSAHVLILAFPYGNHPKPLLTLASNLARAAPNVLFTFFNSEKSNASLFSANIPANLKPHNIPEAVPKDHVMSGNPLEAVNVFLKAAPEMFKAEIDKAIVAGSINDRRITFLITDGFLVFGGEITQSLGVAWIPVWLPLAYALSAHIYTDLIRQICAEEALANEDRRVHKRLEMIPGLSTMRIADLPDEVLPSESVFANTLSQLGHVLPQATAVVMNSYEELSSTALNTDLKSKFRKWLHVGFLSLSLPLPPLPPSSSDSSGCLLWLDEQGASGSSVAYIGFGTVVVPPPHELIALAEALEESRIPFLWSLRDNIKQLLPQGFVERSHKQGKIVPWAPQVEVLGHSSIALFVTHCGCNSVYESIANGVPMICRPFFGDHKMTGRLVEEEWGIGLTIEGGVFTKSGVLKSFETILGNEEGKKMRARAGKLKEVLVDAAGPSASAAQDFTSLVDLISST